MMFSDILIIKAIKQQRWAAVISCMFMRLRDYLMFSLLTAHSVNSFNTAFMSLQGSSQPALKSKINLQHFQICTRRSTELASLAMNLFWGHFYAKFIWVLHARC